MTKTFLFLKQEQHILMLLFVQEVKFILKLYSLYKNGQDLSNIQYVQLLINTETQSNLHLKMFSYREEVVHYQVLSYFVCTR